MKILNTVSKIVKMDQSSYTKNTGEQKAPNTEMKMRASGINVSVITLAENMIKSCSEMSRNESE